MSRRKLIVCAYCLEPHDYLASGLPELEEQIGGWRGWTHNVDDWICEMCVSLGRGIRANPLVQGKYFSYWDVEMRCEYCRQPYVFGAEEQKKWYEDWAIPTKVECRGCQDCRRRVRHQKRAQKALARLLPLAGQGDEELLLEIAEQYIHSETYSKAREFLRRSRNKCNDPEGRRQLLQRMEQLPETDSASPLLKVGVGPSYHFRRLERSERVRQRIQQLTADSRS